MEGTKVRFSIKTNKKNLSEAASTPNAGLPTYHKFTDNPWKYRLKTLVHKLYGHWSIFMDTCQPWSPQDLWKVEILGYCMCVRQDSSSLALRGSVASKAGSGWQTACLSTGDGAFSDPILYSISPASCSPCGTHIPYISPGVTPVTWSWLDGGLLGLFHISLLRDSVQYIPSRETGGKPLHKVRAVHTYWLDYIM